MGTSLRTWLLGSAYFRIGRGDRPVIPHGKHNSTIVQNSMAVEIETESEYFFVSSGCQPGKKHNKITSVPSISFPIVVHLSIHPFISSKLLSQHASCPFPHFTLPCLPQFLFYPQLSTQPAIKRCLHALHYPQLESPLYLPQARFRFHLPSARSGV